MVWVLICVIIPNDRALLFLHIPKTAGTSLREVIGRRFHRDQKINVGLENTGGIHRALSDPDRYRFVSGHLPYSTIALFSERPFVFTIFREPIDRAISAFAFMQKKASEMEQLGAIGKISKERAHDYARAGTLSLSEFVRFEPRAAARHLGNLQVEWLTCADLERRHRYKEDYEISVSNAELDLAMERVSSLDSFGIKERLQDAVEYLAYRLHTSPFGEIPWCNKSRLRPAMEELDEDTVDALKNLTFYDQKLYEFAADQFETLRRQMMRELLTGQCGIGETAALEMNLPASFTAGEHLWGEGWYSDEIVGGKRFHWSGPSNESSILLGTPAGRRFLLRAHVVHSPALMFIQATEFYFNHVPLEIQVDASEDGYVISAPIPLQLLSEYGKSNTVTIRVPRLCRPCDLSETNDDSRMLGIAVSRMELLAVVSTA